MHRIRSCFRLGLPLVLAVMLTASETGVRWGRTGHEIVGLAAATGLPDEMPAFFRDAREQLSWLNYDPDRWRDDASIESNHAFQYDHFIDLEAVPDAALSAQHRFAYLEAMSRSGIRRPENLGLLPFRIFELTQRLTTGFRQWRAATDPRVRTWLEQRIINDAGILGHYVADGANPHHTTIHFNGWDANTPNPSGYTSDRTFHRRFESDFVGALLNFDDVRPRSTAPARELGDLRADVMTYIRQTHGALRQLYDLEKRETFSATTAGREHHAFTAERLAAGANMLRSIWFTAWRRSASP
jgi:hypothetical protein